MSNILRSADQNNVGISGGAKSHFLPLRKSAIAVISTFLVLSPFAADAAGFSFQTLDNSADPTFNQLLGINNAGVIAGYYGSGLDPAHPNKGYTLNAPYTQNNYTNENYPGSAQTQVTGINNKGDSVGFYVDNAGNQHGFAKVGNFLTVTADNPNTGLVNGMSTNQLLAVNNNDVAAGFYVDGQGVTHGETFNVLNNTFNQFDIAGATATTAAAINDAGALGGFFVSGNVTEGFIFSNGLLTPLQDPFGVSTQVLGLNNTGLADGFYTDANGIDHGFIYDIKDQQFTTVDDPNGFLGTVLNGLNDKGQFTGFYVDAAENTNGFLVTETTAVPEPSMLMLIGSGLLTVLRSNRRKSV